MKKLTSALVVALLTGTAFGQPHKTQHTRKFAEEGVQFWAIRSVLNEKVQLYPCPVRTNMFTGDLLFPFTCMEVTGPNGIPFIYKFQMTPKTEWEYTTTK